VSTEDGFAIAERDLEIRGPGDFFGTRQWGLPGLRASNLVRDRDLLEQARGEAFRCVEDMEGGRGAPLKAFLAEGDWERRFGLAGAGAVGLEALSRGAAVVVLVDIAADAVATLRANAAALTGGGGPGGATQRPPAQRASEGVTPERAKDVRIVRQDARVAMGA